MANAPGPGGEQQGDVAVRVYVCVLQVPHRLSNPQCAGTP